MIIAAFGIFYLIGCLVAYVMVLGEFYQKWEALHSVEKAIETYKCLWTDDFDKEWADVERENRDVLLFALILMTGSWITVLISYFDGAGKYKPMICLPPMPDKEKTREYVNSLNR